MALCLLVFLGWQKLYYEPRFAPKPGAAPPAASVVGTTTGAPDGGSAARTTAPSAASTPSRNVPLREETLAVKDGAATVTNDAGLVKGWKLSSYRLTLDPAAPPVELGGVTHQNAEVELAFDAPEFASLTRSRGTLAREGDAVTTVQEDGLARITRKLRADPALPYLVGELEVAFKDPARRPKFAFLSLRAQGLADERDAQDRALILHHGGSLTRHRLHDTIDLKSYPETTRYIGATSRYFVAAIVDTSARGASGLVQPLDASKLLARVSLVYPVESDRLVIPFRFYFGPKELDRLRATEPTLERAVDFGFFSMIGYPILKFMKWLYGYFGNYGIAIIVLTILIKLALFPLNYKSAVSMRKMAVIQPQLAKIREQHKGDPQTLNAELMRTMKTHGYNPAAGCLPVLLQMPVFFALYQVLYSAIELYQAPFGLWIHDLAAQDPFFVTPVLLTATMYLQQKITPMTTMDPAQQKMMQAMPIVFGGFMLFVPSGLTLYMLVNSLTSIAQQFYMNKKLGGFPSQPAPKPA